MIQRFFLLLLLIQVLTVPVKSQQEYLFREGLAISNCHDYARKAVNTDLFVLYYFSEGFTSPLAGGSPFRGIAESNVVEFHMDHVIGEIKKHLRDLAGTGFTHVHFDNYEASMPVWFGWTPKIPKEFNERRGYDITPWLPAQADRKVGTKADSLEFRNDYVRMMNDLYRDVYYSVTPKNLVEAGLTFLSERLGGYWENDEIMLLAHKVKTEFGTDKEEFTHHEFQPTDAALREAGKNILKAEAFNGQPQYSYWWEHPAWLKPLGDGAYCARENRFIVHRFVQQPWDVKYKLGTIKDFWGTHFNRTPTWWEPAKAMFKYENTGSSITIPLLFNATQSFFVFFRKKAEKGKKEGPIFRKKEPWPALKARGRSLLTRSGEALQNRSSLKRSPTGPNIPQRGSNTTAGQQFTAQRLMRLTLGKKVHCS